MGFGHVLSSLLILTVAFELATIPVTAQTTIPAPTTTTTTTPAPTTATTTTPAPTTATTTTPAPTTATTTTTTPTTTTTTTPAPSATTTTTTAAPSATTTTTTPAPSATTTTTTAAPSATTTTTTPAPTTTTTTTPQAATKTNLSFKTKDTFTSDLQNLSSPAAVNRTSKLISTLDPFFKSAFPTYAGLQVTGYSNGSINNTMQLFSSGSALSPSQIANVLKAAAPNITAFIIDTTTISVNGSSASSGVSHKISLITAPCLVLLSWLLTNQQ